MSLPDPNLDIADLDESLGSLDLKGLEPLARKNSLALIRLRKEIDLLGKDHPNIPILQEVLRKRQKRSGELIRKREGIKKEQISKKESQIEPPLLMGISQYRIRARDSLVTGLDKLDRAISEANRDGMSDLSKKLRLYKSKFILAIEILEKMEPLEQFDTGKG
jgi:hypothetical protein